MPATKIFRTITDIGRTGEPNRLRNSPAHNERTALLVYNCLKPMRLQLYQKKPGLLDRAPLRNAARYFAASIESMCTDFLPASAVAFTATRSP
jgi:hypothetical protein